MTDAQVLLYNSDGVTHHKPRPGDRVCECGHPEYCHNPEVPPTFPHDPTDLCVGLYQQHHEIGTPSAQRTRPLPFDPIRLRALYSSILKYYNKHGKDSGPRCVELWQHHVTRHTALVCECRSFRLKEEAHAEATASVE